MYLFRVLVGYTRPCSVVRDPRPYTIQCCIETYRYENCRYVAVCNCHCKLRYDVDHRHCHKDLLQRSVESLLETTISSSSFQSAAAILQPRAVPLAHRVVVFNVTIDYNHRPHTNICLSLS